MAQLGSRTRFSNICDYLNLIPFFRVPFLEISMEHTNKEAHHCHKLDFDITVNGEPETWHQRKINYEQVVKLAFPHGPMGGEIRYNVSWTKPDGQEGSLRPGSKPVDVVEGMMFDVRNTDKS